MIESLQDQISVAMNFTPEDLAPSGFYVCYCPICKKQSRKTGGFYFDDETIVYNCFRASCNASTVLEQGKYIPKKFRRLMDEIGVQIPIELFKQSEEAVKNNEHDLYYELYKPIYFEDISKCMDIPTAAIGSFNPKNEYAVRIIRDYLQKRRVRENAFRYIITDQENEIVHPYKIFVPLYYGKKMIGYQLINIKRKFMETKGHGNKSLIYVPDGFMHRNPIVVEGVFDALTVPNGIGILGNSINKQMAYLLKGKDPILLPDRDNAVRMVQQAKIYGWRVCIPEWAEKDANQAVQNKGKIVVAKQIRDGIMDNYDEAELRAKLWEKKG